MTSRKHTIERDHASGAARRAGRRRTAFAAAAVALVLGSCSSTEESADDATTTVAPATTEPAAATTEPAAPDTTAAEGAATTEAPATTAPEPVRGVDGDTVRVGFVISTNQEAAQAAIGTTGITFVPHQEIVDTLVADLNAGGGLGGKEIVPVIHETDQVADTDPQAISREICATMTEDNEVYAIVTIGDPSTEVLACANDAGVPLFASSGANFTFSDQGVYDANPLYVNPSAINLDRAATALVEGLDQAGFFTDDAVVGVIRLSSPAFDAAAANSLEPALAAAGVEPVVTAALATIATSDDIGRFSSEAEATVLEMKEAGVTHLVFFESGGAAPFFFLAAARNQGFEPALGVSSLSGGQTLVQNIGTGGTAVAWSPVGDVPEASQLPESPAATECLDLVDSTRAVFTSANAVSETLRFCDAVWVLQAAVEAAGGTVAAADLVGAVEGLGDSYQSPTALATTFGPGRRDGVSEYYLTDYDPSCSCNVYRAGGPYPID
jgi:ABC-type branched-subunit amino acid transport system substrate-binding protein